jgi:hypothetical protein
MAERQQHSLLVIADRARRAGAQQQLAAVDRYIGAEKAHLVAVSGLLRDADELVELDRRDLHSLLGDQLVERAELDERDRRGAVLGGGRRRQEVRAQLRRQTSGDDLERRRRQRTPGLRGAHRRTRDQQARAERGAEAAGRQQFGCRLADEDLARRGYGLHRHRGARGRAGDQVLLVGVADEERLVGAAVHADRDPQANLDRARAVSRQLAQRLAHGDRGGAGTRGMVIAVEPQQQRIAAELDQRCAHVVGLRQQRGEAGVDRVGQLLGALVARSRQALGESGETGHVSEHDGRFEAAHPFTRRLLEVFEQHGGDVGGQRPCVSAAADHCTPKLQPALVFGTASDRMGPSGPP